VIKATTFFPSKIYLFFKITAKDSAQLVSHIIFRLSQIKNIASTASLSSANKTYEQC